MEGKGIDNGNEEMIGISGGMGGSQTITSSSKPL